jgi:hypothetical protein
MNIEIKPFIHQIRFTPQIIRRPLTENFRLLKSCRHAWLTDRRRETNRRPAEAANFF